MGYKEDYIEAFSQNIHREGSEALLDPAVEIGDAVTVDGHYVPLIALDMTFDPLLAPDISAPDADEIDDEYPYKSPTQRQIERNMAKTESSSRHGCASSNQDCTRATPSSRLKPCSRR